MNPTSYNNVTTTKPLKVGKRVTLPLYECHINCMRALNVKILNITS